MEMKKWIVVIVVSMVAVFSLASAGFVYAQSIDTPTSTPQPWGGMMGGRGARGGMMGGTVNGSTGFMHDDMVEAFAQKLGLTVDDVNARIAGGETMYQIATAQGYTAETFTTLMTEVRAQALTAAVQAGEITQEQADWMSQRSAGRMAGRGAGMMGRGMMNGANCPYYSSTQTPQ
jgi:hypothetical protein